MQNRVAARSATTRFFGLTRLAMAIKSDRNLYLLMFGERRSQKVVSGVAS
jgi:hypothetical protein